MRLPPTSAQLRSDIWLAAALFVGVLISAVLGGVSDMYAALAAPYGWAVPVGAVMCGALAFRRRYPCTVAVIVTVCFYAFSTLRIPEVILTNVAMFIAFYTVGAWVNNRRRAFTVRIVIVIGMFVWLLVTTFQAATDVDAEKMAGVLSPFLAFSLLQFLINALYFSGAYYMGNQSFASALAVQELQARTRELEQEKERSGAQAVALDRVRIARELHDVVAHHVSAMGVQAGAARAVLASAPDKTEKALSAIEVSARNAIEELHQLLYTLRSPNSGDPSPSTIGLAGIPKLLGDVAETGLKTNFAVVGTPVELPALTQVNLYRVTQEALTNARRHGGASIKIDVRLRYQPDSVEIEIVNTGHLARISPGGLGLVGMRERMATSGGEVEARPMEQGGFLVRARVPVAGGQS